MLGVGRGGNRGGADRPLEQRLTGAAFQMSPLGARRAELPPPSTRCNTDRPSVVSSASTQSGWRTHCFRAEKPPAPGTPNMTTSDPQTPLDTGTRRNTLPAERPATRGSSARLGPTWALAAPRPAPSPRPGHASYQVFRGESHCNCDRVQPLAPPNAPPLPPLQPVQF